MRPLVLVYTFTILAFGQIKTLFDWMQGFKLVIVSDQMQIDDDIKLLLNPLIVGHGRSRL